MVLKVCLQSRHVGARGGLEKWARRIAEGFVKRGAHVDLLTTDAPSLPHVKTHTLSPKHLLSYRKMKGFDALCQKWQKHHPRDIVFGMDRTSRQTHIRAGNGVHAAYLQRRLEYENYSSFKAALNPLNRTILQLEKEAFESPDLKVLFTNSYMVKHEILQFYNVSPDKIEVIHNGTEWKDQEESFQSWVEKKPAIAKKFGLDPSLFHFLFVGNGYERKGLSFLLRALKHLTPKGFHLSVVGKDQKTQKFQALTEALGLSKKVRFFGPQSDLTPFYQLSDALLIPSIYDPFANVTVEALGMGLFVVSSKHNGGHEVLHEENGTTIETLSHLDACIHSLEMALHSPKTWVRSQTIRKSVEHL
ncbi:MAG: glycosyltransferase family 4 protein, partial [Chlamydiia bacterium]|nr:glycosyltransferase family 4 protein [Chlamydiia bacterium]